MYQRNMEKEAAVDSTKIWWPLGEHGDEFRTLVESRTPALTEETVQAVEAEVPELVGPDPRLRELLSLVVSANLENFAAVIAFQVPAETTFEPPAAIEHARALAQRGVPANSILLGYQVIQRMLTGPVIDAVQTFVADRDELVRTLEAVLALLVTQTNSASRAALRTHASERDTWQRGRGAGLSRRLDAVLDRTVTDAHHAERALNYVMSGNHVALIAWLDDPDRPLDMVEAERSVAQMHGVSDALLVPRDERTLYCWVHTPDGADMDQWMSVAQDVHEARIAFGEIAEGIEGFRLSHMQARSAGAVINASRRPEASKVVRYRDVAALSFLVDRPTESRGWVRDVLGELAEVGEDRERLRETLLVFLEEGENAVTTGERLFIHRNTVKYRVDRAISLLPEPIGSRRFDVGLALRYCDWVGSPVLSDRNSPGA